MAGNENVIDSLKLEIGVNIKGQNKLDSFTEKLLNLSSALVSVNEQLRAYSATLKTIGNINFPKVNVPQVTTDNTPAPSPASSDTEVVAPVYEEATESAEEYVEVQSQVEQTTKRTAAAISSLKSALDKANISMKDMKSLGSKLVSSLKKLKSSVAGLIKGFARIVKYRAFRAILRTITEGLREGVQNLAQFDSKFNETMSSFVTSTQYLKNALGTLAQPLLEIVIPIIVEVIDKIVEAINYINQLIAQVKGLGTFTAAKKVAVDYAKNLDKASKSAKEIKNTLMGFDEINRLNGDSSSSASGTSVEDMFEIRETDLSNEAVDRVKKTLKAIEKIAGSMLLAIGCLLVCTGHLALGIACIIAGIKLVKASLNINVAKDRVSKMLSDILTIVGTAMMAIGAILIATGHIALGVACFVAGAAAIASSVLIDWGKITDKVSQVLGIITTIVAGAALAVGMLMLASPGHWGLAIALIALGAAGLVASLALNWNGMSEKTKKVVTAITSIVSVAMLAVGAVLTFSGANIPLGIALMAVGMAGAVTIIALNWNKIKEFISNNLTQIGAVLSGAALVVGGILALSGVALPLGIALMALGAAGLVTTGIVNWDTMSEKTQYVLTTLGRILGAALLAIGAILAFTGVAIPLGVAMMAAGGVTLAKTTNIDWDALANKFSQAMDKLKAKVKEKLDHLKEQFSNWKASLKAPHLQWQEGGYQTTGWVRKALEALNLPTQLPKLHVEWYANGGFPEDGLFMANHGELVGQFANGRTAVANNEQIEAGIEEAAYRGFMRAMSGQGGNYTFVAQLNGKTIFEEVVKQNYSATKAYGASPLTVY